LGENGTWVEYYRATSSVVNGTLGTFDPTLLENGCYTVRLVVVDKAGNKAGSECQIVVDGQQKIGVFSLAFEDMSIPLPGLQLSVERGYDSRNRGMSGDFGYGWQMSLKSIKMSQTCKPGENWELQLSNGPVRQFSLKPTSKHTISIPIPGGRTQVFDAVAELYNVFDPTYGKIAYRAQPGTYSTLEPIDAGSFYITGGILYDENGDFSEPYNPKKYKLTFLDGTAYHINRENGVVTKITDANGNAIDITDNEIRHSANMSVLIQRDASNRIISISDMDNRIVRYVYDGSGDLQKVISPSGAITRFKYRQNHYLMEIIDPTGVKAIRTEYDETGRMVRQINAAGDTIAFTHDLDNNTEITRDFIGNETKYTYDTRGNVVSKVDALNNRWEYVYDQFDNLIETKDPQGYSTRSTFDLHGNELTSTDALNRTTVRTYSGSSVLTETDALNRTTSYEYDTRGNLVTVRGPDNIITEEKTYDSFGNILTEKSAAGMMTRYEYDQQGRMVAKIDPLGRKTSYILDNRGNTIADVNVNGDTTIYIYDSNNNQTTVINSTGDTYRTEYNVFNKVSVQIDAKGNATSFEYDMFGQLKRTIAPDSTFTEKEYDPNGNMSATIDEMERMTKFIYDHEKRVVRTIQNDNSSTQVIYDKLGRRTATIDAMGNSTEYVYDAVGNNTVVRDVYGNETVYMYDAANRKIEMVDALGQHTYYTYDNYDRLIQTTFDDGSYTRVEYDFDGRKIREIDQEGKVSQFAYDSVGNLVKVTDAMNHETKYSYDNRNNRISQTDANNRTTTMEYDRQNRMISRVYPNGDTEQFIYDISGNVVCKVAGNGDSTYYRYNNRNREIERIYKGGHEVYTSYTADGKQDTVRDYHGETVFEYDSVLGYLNKVTNPDGTYLQYSYDGNKNKIATSTQWGTTYYSYDNLNRMKTVIHGTDTTLYFYNTVGNRDSVYNTNGTGTGYDYDNLNRLLKVTNYRSTDTVLSSYEYTLNKAGMRTAVVEKDSSRVEYVYDDLYKLVSETRTGIHAYTISYVYDYVGNRLQQTKNGIATTYLYNNRDQLVSEHVGANSTTYSYDQSGRMVTKVDNTGTTRYTWIDEDRLTSVQSPQGFTTYEYDFNNNRISTVTDTVAKKYLIDMTLPYGQVIAEYDNNSSLKCSYVYGLERISQSRNDTVHYYVADGQGSIRALTDVNGNITDTYFYTAFGEELAKTGTTENEFRYVGEQWDPNAGFYYLRARWMDPGTGRFVSVDPYAGDPQAPVSLHRYLYAGASPLSFNDPTGKSINLVSMMQTVAIHAILFASRHRLLMTAMGFAAGLLIPEEAQLTLMNSGNPGLTGIGAVGNAELKMYRLIKSEWAMNHIKNHSKLAGKLWDAIGKGFENCVGKYLLGGRAEPQVLTGVGKYRFDFLWRNIAIEVKSGAIDNDQLAAIAKYAEEKGCTFAYIFLNKPSGSEFSKIKEAGGMVYYLFD
jgi:RHS repeat-associated protein